MTDRRMLIVEADLVKKIDENRGDLSFSEFINFLMDNQIKEKNMSHNSVSREEFRQFQEGTKELLRRFLEFFLSYGLELGRQTGDDEFQELSEKLRTLGGSVKAKNS